MLITISKNLRLHRQPIRGSCCRLENKRWNNILVAVYDTTNIELQGQEQNYAVFISFLNGFERIFAKFSLIYDDN